MTMVMDRITYINHLFSCRDPHGHVWIKVINEFQVFIFQKKKKIVKGNFLAYIVHVDLFDVGPFVPYIYIENNFEFQTLQWSHTRMYTSYWPESEKKNIDLKNVC